MSNLQPVCSACWDFVFNGQQRRATIIIAPLVIRYHPGMMDTISWACSRGRVCCNAQCIYSRGAVEVKDETSNGDA